MVAADGAVLAIVDLANSSMPNSQTISAAFARGGRMLNGRGMECQVSRQRQEQRQERRQEQRQERHQAGAKCAAKCGIRVGAK